MKSKEKARIHIGDKVPVITTTAGATGFVSESVNYLDVGLKLEVEPLVHLEDDVGIKVGLEVSNIAREISTPSGTVAYQVGTRNAATTLRLRDGETQVLAGLINDEDRRSADAGAGPRAPAADRAPVLQQQRHGQQDRDRAADHAARGAQHRAARGAPRGVQLGHRAGGRRRRGERAAADAAVGAAPQPSQPQPAAAAAAAPSPSRSRSRPRAGSPRPPAAGPAPKPQGRCDERLHPDRDADRGRDRGAARLGRRCRSPSSACSATRSRSCAARCARSAARSTPTSARPTRAASRRRPTDRGYPPSLAVLVEGVQVNDEPEGREDLLPAPPAARPAHRRASGACAATPARRLAAGRRRRLRRLFTSSDEPSG